MVGVAVAAHDDLGVLAAHAHIQHTHLLDVLAGAHTARAEDAGAHVVLDHDIAGTFVAGAERKLVVSADRDIVLHDVALELVSRMTSAVASGDSPPAPLPPFSKAWAVGEVLARIALQQQSEHAPPIVDRSLPTRSRPPCPRPPAWRRRAPACSDPGPRPDRSGSSPRSGAWGTSTGWGCRRRRFGQLRGSFRPVGKRRSCR